MRISLAVMLVAACGDSAATIDAKQFTFVPGTPHATFSTVDPCTRDPRHDHQRLPAALIS